MQITNTDYFILFSVTYVLVGLLTPLFKNFAISKNILDRPTTPHKTHSRDVPYLGGVAILVGVVIVSYTALIFDNYSAYNFWLATSVLAPALAMGFVGLWDDMKSLPPLPRLIIQLIAGLVVAGLLVSTQNYGNPTGSTLIDVLITIFWIVGICNSINFFDNLDGGAAGTSAITAFFLTFLSVISGQAFIAALSIVVTGATLGFLIWNKSPARIYMGDAGALFLGILLATLTLRFQPDTQTRLASFAIPLLLLAVPILDTTVAVFSRVRRGISPLKGGRDHLSHRLIRLGISRKLVAVSLWILSFFFGVLAVILTEVSKKWEIYVVISALVMWLLLFLSFFRTPDH